LRDNRQEATSIPNLLVAPKDPCSDDSRAIYETGVGDYRGWYVDGAYCAAPQESSQTWDETADNEDEDGKDPQLAYFDSIISRYEALRAQLQQTPPPEAVARLDKDRPTYLGKLNTEVARLWRWKMRQIDPVPAQIASMSKVTVLKLLGLLTTGTLLKRGAEVQVGVSRWAWALLARLPERGELTSEEIGIVRDLGKKAVLVGMGLKEEQAWEEGMEEVEAGLDDEYYEEGSAVVNGDEIDLNIEGGFEDSELDPLIPETDTINDDESNKRQKMGQITGPRLPTDSTVPVPITKKQDDEEKSFMANGTGNHEDEGELSAEDLVAAKARMLAALNGSKEEPLHEAEIFEEENLLKLKKGAERCNTKATVDMIITVAGEMYGQRDLLEFRQVWGDIQEE
jgi:hypothetical protein